MRCFGKRPWSDKFGPRQAVSTTALLLALGTHAIAGGPDWLRELAQVPLPEYPDDPAAVMLLHERKLTVSADGEIEIRTRQAFRILRSEGRSYGTVSVLYGDDDHLTYFKGWSLPAAGKDFTVKEKDAVETQTFGDLYSDRHAKILRIPAADPGNVIAFESRRKSRPMVLEDAIWLDQEIPIRLSRYMLELPRGWEFDARWVNQPETEPRKLEENAWVWEIRDRPALPMEPNMPDWRAEAGRVVVTLFPGGRRGDGDWRSLASWEQIGRWYERLSKPQRQATAELREKVAELTAHAETPLDEIRALAAFAQRDIRYVAIEIGVGAYRPSAAPETLTNRFGDCKDKANLLATMLGEIGIESHLVLVHSRRGVVKPEAPSVLGFDHVIVALRLAEETPRKQLYAWAEGEPFQSLLFFDPTDSLTPLGYLPTALQGGFGLIASEDGGDLMRLPALPPQSNRMLRVGEFSLNAAGDLSGNVREIWWGGPAAGRRATLLQVPEPERRKTQERFLGAFLGGVSLRSWDVKNLENFDQNLVVDYSFTARDYAQRVGDLLLVRPKVLGAEGIKLSDAEDRNQPVAFESAIQRSDVVTIRFPDEYEIDELPPPVDAPGDFVEYHSRVKVDGRALKYTRTYVVKALEAPPERWPELKDVLQRIADDERSLVVLKRSSTR